jgi:hypothetical protein
MPNSDNAEENICKPAKSEVSQYLCQKSNQVYRDEMV